jgi:hypothetical protein
MGFFMQVRCKINTAETGPKGKIPVEWNAHRILMRAPSRKLVFFSATAYLLGVAMLIHNIRADTAGHFSYALDDPYIHLALAEHLAHGHYGINVGELSTPSSSILWPFLLIPLAGTKLHVYLPLVWNIIFGTAAACLIGVVVARWPPQQDEHGQMPLWQQMVTAGLLLLTANLVSLTIVGMEHVLQVLLAICCAFGTMEALSDRPIPEWCLAAAIIAPAVRYEDFTLTAAMCIVLAGLRMWKKMAAVLVLSLLPVLAFTLFLKAHGLPGLPMSVLVKGSAIGNHLRFLPRMIQMARNSVMLGIYSPERFSLEVLFFIFATLTYTATTRVRRYVFLGAAIVAGLQLAVGTFGWFYRYQVYALIFLVLLLMRVLAEKPRFIFGYFAMGLLFCASPFIVATETTPAAATEVYRQQNQMHRFVTEFYSGSYAVNDLGWPSFRRRPGTYVLDVYGLASLEAAEHPVKTAAWLEDVVKRHNVDLAMLYPEWFRIPLSWIPVAKLCLVEENPIAVGKSCIVFYSTSREAEPAIREDLKRFAATLPSGESFYFDPERREGGVKLPVDRAR